MKRQKLASCTKALLIRKWQIQAIKANFVGKKNGEYAKKLIKSLAKYSNQMTKRGMLTAGDFQENNKFGKQLSKV